MGKKRILWSILFVLLAGLTIAAVVTNSRNFSPGKMFLLMKRMNKGWLVLALVFMFGYIFFEGYALVLMAEKMGYKMSPLRGFTYGGADIYFSAITPSATGGQPATAYFLVKDGLPPSAAAVLLLINLVMYTAALLITGLWGLVFGFEVFMGFSLPGRVLIGIGSIMQAGMIVLFCLLLKKTALLHGFFGKILCFLIRIGLIKQGDRWKARLDRIMDEYQDCSEFIFGKGKLMAEVLFWNLLQRLSYLFVTFLVFMGALQGPVKALQMMKIQSLVTVGANYIPIPGAMGAADLLMMDGLKQAVTPDTIVAMELLCRGFTFYGSVAAGFLIVLIGSIRRKAGKADAGFL